MDVALPKTGTYVVAVSGGVDSMALLHLLHQHNLQNSEQPLKLVVAHLDHGIRPDADEDRRLVEEVARDYGLPFVYQRANLGSATSEAAAREARYNFLYKVLQSSGSRAIMTAHHQDDVLETAILNMLRGSGRKGLASLTNQHDIVRPLLQVPKAALIAYAKDQGLRWREDSTNLDPRYARNYVRHYILPRFSQADRLRLLQYIQDLQQANHVIDSQLTSLLHLQPKAGHIDRQWFTKLPHAVALEVMATWLRSHQLRDFTSQALERLTVAAKTAQPGSSIDIMKGAQLQVSARTLALKRAER